MIVHPRTNDHENDDDRPDRRLARVLESEAETYEVGEAWDAIAARVREDRARPGPINQPVHRSGGRVLRVLAAGVGVAAIIWLAVVLSGRPASGMPGPLSPGIDHRAAQRQADLDPSDGGGGGDDFGLGLKGTGVQRQTRSRSGRRSTRRRPRRSGRAAAPAVTTETALPRCRGTSG